MVNQTVLDYLKNYGNRFSLDDLRKKIVEGGYSEEDFNEAASALGLNRPAAHVLSMPDVVEKSSGVRWMRFAGIIGIAFLVLSAIFFVLSFFSSSFASSGSLSPAVGIAILALVFLMFISYLFFLKGFAKMGKYTSKLLRFSSITLVVLSIIVVVLGIAATLIFFRSIGNMVSSLPSSTSDLSSDFSGGITGAAVSDVGSIGNMSSVGSAGALGWAILITVILAAVFFLVIQTLFFVGLIISGKQVKFAKLAGIFGIVLLAVSIFASLYIFSNPFLMVEMLLSGTLSSFLIVMQILLYVLSLLLLLFETLCLFDASKKFENSDYES